MTSIATNDGEERDLLLSRLAGQLEGLSDSQRRRAVLPSGWSCLGSCATSHSDERYWFEVAMAGGTLDFWPNRDNGDWRVNDDEPAADVVDAYRAAMVGTDTIVAGLSLDDPPARPEAWWREQDVRSQICGPCPSIISSRPQRTPGTLTRELLDGRQHLVL